MKAEQMLLKMADVIIKARLSLSKGFEKSPGYYHMPRRPNRTN